MSTISASTTSTTAFKVTSDTTGTLVLQTGSTPTTAVTITSAQKVGIGTSSPAVMLDIVSTGTPSLRLSNTGSNAGIQILTASTTYNWLLGAQYTASNAFEITPSTAVGGTGLTFSNPALVVTTSDGTNSYVNIGRGGQTSYPLQITQNPTSSSNPMLVINPSTGTNASFTLWNNTGLGEFRVGRSDSTGNGSGTAFSAYDSFVWNTGLQSIYFGTNNTSALLIDTGQNVKAQKALSAGNTAANMTAGLNAPGASGTGATVMTGGVYLPSYSTSVGLPSFIQNWASPANFGIGTHSGTNDNIVRVGQCTVSGGGYAWNGTYCNIYAGAYTNASDYRIKENVRDISKTGMLAKIRQLRGVIYNIIPNTDDTGITSVVKDEMGYIAHEAQEIFPLLVTGEKDAVDGIGNPLHQGMDYSRMVVPLAAALAELADAFDAYVASHP